MASRRCEGTRFTGSWWSKYISNLAASSFLPRLTCEWTRPNPLACSLSQRRVSRSSDHCSATMSQAPCRAACSSGTSFSGLTNGRSTSDRGRPSGRCRSSKSASGCSPRSRAIAARVRRLGLNGRYKSSSTCLSWHCSICCRSSGVSSPCWSIVRRIVALRCASSCALASASSIIRSAVSSSPPVASLR